MAHPHLPLIFVLVIFIPNPLLIPLYYNSTNYSIDSTISIMILVMIIHFDP